MTMAVPIGPHAPSINFPPASDSSATDTDMSTKPISGDWFIELAQILVARADSKLQVLMSDAKDSSSQASALAGLVQGLSKYTDMDHRKGGNDGDPNKTSDNDANYADAENWDATIEAAVSKLPGGADNPMAQQLRGLEFGTDKAAHPDAGLVNDHSQFICDAADMGGRQAALGSMQKANDSEGSMRTFLVQQAIQERDQTITLLAGLQQEINATIKYQLQNH